jgi:UDP-N-acetylglucosamine 1-carboxyvinyltransferase
MDMLVVRGGQPRRGTVCVGGAKNAALPIMAASLVAEGTTVLRGVPDLVDVSTLSHVLRSLGAEVERRDDGAMLITVVDQQPCLADYELVRRMRASVCVLGPLLGRRRRACVSLPGGCNIGHRPIDLHLKGLRALGAEITIERGYVFARADRLKGADIYLGGPFGCTVTGTCNVMSAAVLAEGTTTISAAACEPEVVDLGLMLNAMGARIEGLGTPLLRIEGVRELHAVEHTIIPDRIEAATLMVAAAMTRGELTIENIRPDHLSAVTDVIRAAGSTVEFSNAVARVHATSAPRPVDVTALPYPGVPTDVQAQLTALLALSNGISIVTDKVFPDRFMHIPELMRLGAGIRREGASAIINGIPAFSGACVMASDLRASAALLLAGLAAQGESVIRRVYHLDRGYERLERKLNLVGADIRRIADIPENMPSSLQLATDELASPVVDPSDMPPPPKFLRHADPMRRQGNNEATAH